MTIEERFYSLFRGYTEAKQLAKLLPWDGKGKRKADMSGSRGLGNLKGKSPTLQDVENHLAGVVALGIVPLNEYGQCLWGCLDIDDPSEDLHKKVINRMQGTTLIATYSKSKGLRVWVFFTEFILAADLMTKLRELAIYLGAPGAEVFPKQPHFMAAQGDMGSPLLLPYHEPYMGTVDNLPLEKFIEKAEESKIPPSEFLSLKFSDDTFSDAPPCVEVLATAKLQEGQRNNGFFAFLVYLKKKLPDSWLNNANNYNLAYCATPLPMDELATLIKSAKKANYHYPCTKEPCVSHCNKQICRMRKYGIGMEGNNQPIILSASKFNTQPPIWFLDVSHKGVIHRLEAKTEDLQNQTRFQQLCINALNIYPTKLKQDAWEAGLSDILSKANIIEPPQDLLPINILKNKIYDFYFSNAQASNITECVYTSRWLKTDSGKILFRNHSLLSFLSIHDFKDMDKNQIGFSAKEFGGSLTSIEIDGRKISFWELPESFFPPRPQPLPIPRVEEVI